MLKIDFVFCAMALDFKHARIEDEWLAPTAGGSNPLLELDRQLIHPSFDLNEIAVAFEQIMVPQSLEQRGVEICFALFEGDQFKIGKAESLFWCDRSLERGVCVVPGTSEMS
jgi:hypothetical protein